MKREVAWAPTALDDFDLAVGYIAERNPAAAQRIAEALRNTGSDLGTHATGRPGRIAGGYEKSLTGLPYIIAYDIELLPDGQERIVIIHIIHTSRDWPKGKWPK